jgi:hypothetical protein
MADVDRKVQIHLSATDETRLAVEQAKRGLKGYGDESSRIASQMRGQWQTIKGNWLALTGAVTASIIALRKAWDFAEFAAKFEEQKEAVGALAAQWGVGADEMLASIQKAARGLISLSEATDLAARAFSLGFSPDQITDMTSAAERFADVWGGDVVDATESLAQAIATQQTRSLKQIGIVIDTEKVMKDFAATLGVSRDRLTEAGERAAMYAEVMKKVKAQVEALGPATDSNMDKMDRMSKQWDDIKLAVGGALIHVGHYLLTVADAFLVQWYFLKMSFLKGLNEIDEFMARFGLTTGMHFKENIATAEASMQASWASMKQNWADLWTANEKKAEVVLTNVKDVQEALFKPAVPVAAIPLPMPDATEQEQALSEIEQWAAAKYDIVLRWTEKEKLLYNGMTEAEFQNWEEKKQIQSSALGDMASVFQTFANIQGEHQGAAFALFKAFAVAQAVIDTQVAAMRALAIYGPTPQGFILAAVAVAVGLARVAAILSTQPRGSTAVVSSVGPGSSGVNQPSSQQPQQSSGPTIVNVTVLGSMVSQDGLARSLVAPLQKAMADGVR